MNDEQNEIPEFDGIGLTDTQTRFFSDHKDKIKRYWAESDLENLSKEANFFLNQFKTCLQKNNELKEPKKKKLQNTPIAIICFSTHSDRFTGCVTEQQAKKSAQAWN